jgi:hypothetical protein
MKHLNKQAGAAWRTAIAAAVIASALFQPGRASADDYNGVSDDKSPGSTVDNVVDYIFDRKPEFREVPVETLPPVPATDAALLPFEVSGNTPLVYAIDPDSLTLGKDAVLRYAIVITSPAGARNVFYEGIRCDGFIWRRYAAADENGTSWDRQAQTDWARIERNELNAYHAALYGDYFCSSRSPAGSVKTILGNMRYKRTRQKLEIH